MEFEWDENKEEINIRKHGVNLNEAQKAFYDENAIDDYDEFHSDEEQRFALIGLLTKRLLFVSYTDSPKHRNSSDFSEKGEPKSREILQ